MSELSPSATPPGADLSRPDLPRPDLAGAGPSAAAVTAAGPFDPAGVRWQPVSPRLTTVRLISVGLWLLPPLAGGVVAAVLSGEAGLWVIPAVVAAFGVWVAIVIPRQVRAIGYAERDDDLLIRKGVMMRSLVVVPYGRMQFVDVGAGPLDRWGGIARVQLHTASPGTDAAIPGLVPTEAARLRDRLAARGEAQLAGL
ncbi:PH domain-containing protein [Cellulomonas sp. KRMCY2]|uniref:PH domain-containing protein n=1 Tax=Cellulomonas sp. KRMCY2 TaxID=1304865 RepID=UPI00045EAB24|nr:PH domain-containing protein [Cellulomonas sp. KRMCY2]